MTERATGAIVDDRVIEDVIARLRKRVDEYDEDIIGLVQERQWLSAAIRRHKRRIGNPSIDLTREGEITSRYVKALGPSLGSEIANAVLHYSKDLT